MTGRLIRDLTSAAADVLARRPRRASGPPTPAAFYCLLCGGESAHELMPESVPESRGYHVARCDRCGLVATVPPPPVEAIPAFYGEEYYGTENKKFGPLTELFIFLFRVARLRAVYLTGIRRGALLDLGCGRGLFLRVMQRAGFLTWGTELDEASARAARQSGSRVATGALVDGHFEAGQFDVITAWHAFEHFRDPDVVLRECHRILRPGGALIMSMPNIESWQARWAGASWFHLDLPRHLFHYSPSTITALLDAHGFRVERISHYSLEQNPFGLLQSALHRVGGTHLGLYRLLRGPMDRRQRSRARRLPLLAAYLAAFMPAAAISTCWSLLRSGATFTVLARRVE
jgi:2-polyprenyl-3-methyl-5-hydroxy-6-metoxy-1,4-benzoquinol methylase